MPYNLTHTLYLLSAWRYIFRRVAYLALYGYIICQTMDIAAQAIDCAILSDYAVCDPFADANLLNPTWSGDAAAFMVNANAELQSNGSGTDTIALSTPIGSSGVPTEWVIKVRMEFDPSDNNRSSIYLLVDQADLKSPTLSGYYLRLGENGAADAISLYRQNNGVSSLVVRGSDATVAFAPDLYIRVTYNESGEWNIYTAAVGGSYVLDASVNEPVPSFGASFMGVWCKHTATNATKFFFDDIYVANPPLDTTPPIVVGVNASPNLVSVAFSEAISPSTAQNTDNYNITGGIVIDAATLDEINPAWVNLSLTTPLMSGVNYTLTINNITDLAGNALAAPTTFDLFYYEEQPRDVVINEILADPDPAVGLPPYEFVELYNRTDMPISLGNWQFGDNATAPQTFFAPNVVLPAQGYLVICAPSADALAAFAALGVPAMGLSGFPSLNNSGDALVLFDEMGNLIDAVTYSDSWYASSNKREGGWALEQIDPDVACTSAGNWRESDNSNGGTPGAANSVTGVYDDTTAPQIMGIQIIDPQTILLLTSENVYAPSAEQLSNYTLSGGIDIADISVELEAIQLTLSSPLQIATLYTLAVTGISDCSGNVLVSYSNSFALPQIADTYDILISEIYADTDTPEEFAVPTLDLPAAKYIELYNRSDKTISLQGWYLTDLSDTTQLAEYLLPPSSRVVLCSSTKTTLFTERGIAALGVTAFTDPNTSADRLSIFNAEGTLIHSVSYDKTWYRDPVKQEGGWSLEMIDTNNPCEGAANWQASDDPKGGTPAALNAVARANPDQVVPDLLRAEVVNPNLVLLYFSEILDRQTAETLANYTFDQGIGQPITASLLSPSNKQVLLGLAMPLPANTIYTVTANLVSDCAGNPIGLYNSAQVGIAETPQTNEIVINEVLFNPVIGGYDYVELYNRSNKILSLSGWYFAQIDIAENPDSVTAYLPLLTERYTLFPDQYVVLTENPEQVIAHYGQCGATIPTRSFLRTSDLPTLNDDEGIVAIVSLFAADTLDMLHYFDSWHNPLLDTPDGFALERIDYTRPTQDANNWQSGASAACGGTPGYLNSQFLRIDNTADLNSISIEPPAISPDGDAYNDFAIISYQFDASGYVIDILLYDERGRELQHLVRNEIAATEGYYKWDGSLANGEKAPIGIYTLRIQAIGTDGEARLFKKSVAIVGQK